MPTTVHTETLVLWKGRRSTSGFGECRSLLGARRPLALARRDRGARVIWDLLQRSQVRAQRGQQGEKGKGSRTVVLGHRVPAGKGHLTEGLSGPARRGTERELGLTGRLSHTSVRTWACPLHLWGPPCPAPRVRSPWSAGAAARHRSVSMTAVSSGAQSPRAGRSHPGGCLLLTLGIPVDLLPGLGTRGVWDRVTLCPRCHALWDVEQRLCSLPTGS